MSNVFKHGARFLCYIKVHNDCCSSKKLSIIFNCSRRKHLFVFFFLVGSTGVPLHNMSVILFTLTIINTTSFVLYLFYFLSINIFCSCNDYISQHKLIQVPLSYLKNTLKGMILIQKLFKRNCTLVNIQLWYLTV